jgi:cytochrome c-type biogenesis protein CcmH
MAARPGARRVVARRTLTLLCLAALAAPTLVLAGPALTSTAAAAPVKQLTNLTSVEHEVMCVTCKIPLQVAKSVQANREREYIQSLVDQGLTKAQVKQELVNQYGEAVLANPPAHGFNLTVYLVPLAVVLGLIALVATLLPAWRRHARAQGPLTVDQRLDPADTARLDADLSRFD